MTLAGLALSLSLIVVAVGCGSMGDAQATGLEIPDAETTPPAAVGGVQSLVTRIVERITAVSSTPDPQAAIVVDSPPVVLDIGLTGSLPNLDPGLAQSQAQLDLSQNLFVGLTNYNPDTHTVEPELASSWSVGPDGRTWTFRLRDDVFWVSASRPRPRSDELWSATPVRAVTADDVVFAIERICSRQVEHAQAHTLFIIDGCKAVFTTAGPTDEDRAITGLRAIDPTTLEIRLTEPAGYFLTLSSMAFFHAVPRELVTEMGNEWVDANGDISNGWQTPNNLVSSGPYMLVPAETTFEKAVLHRNPLWPIDRPGNADVVNVQFFGSEADAFALWQERGLDIAPLPFSEREQVIERTPAKAKILPDPVLFYIGFNLDSQVFREPEVRRAFSAAIDRQRLVDEIYSGRGMVMRHVTLPDIVASLPVDEAGVGYSPDYARQQMAASTFRGCRLMPEIRLLVSTADLSLLQAELIRDMWIEELECLPEGIIIEQAQFGALLSATRQDAVGRPDMWELAWAPTFPDAHNLLHDLLHCRNSENRQNRECSEVDTVLQQASTTVDPAERDALYRRAESLFFNENGASPIAPLYIRAREMVFQSDWITFTPVAFGGQQWDRVVIDADFKELEQSR